MALIGAGAMSVSQLTHAADYVMQQPSIHRVPGTAFWAMWA